MGNFLSKVMIKILYELSYLLGKNECLNILKTECQILTGG